MIVIDCRGLNLTGTVDANSGEPTKLQLTLDEMLFVVFGMLNLTGDKAIRISHEGPQTCTGAEIHDLSTVERVGILVWLTDLASANRF